MGESGGRFPLWHHACHSEWPQYDSRIFVNFKSGGIMEADAPLFPRNYPLPKGADHAVITNLCGLFDRIELQDADTAHVNVEIQIGKFLLQHVVTSLIGPNHHGLHDHCGKTRRPGGLFPRNNLVEQLTPALKAGPVVLLCSRSTRRVDIDGDDDSRWIQFPHDVNGQVVQHATVDQKLAVFRNRREYARDRNSGADRASQVSPPMDDRLG